MLGVVVRLGEDRGRRKSPKFSFGREEDVHSGVVLLLSGLGRGDEEEDVPAVVRFPILASSEGLHGCSCSETTPVFSSKIQKTKRCRRERRGDLRRKKEVAAEREKRQRGLGLGILGMAWRRGR